MFGIFVSFNKTLTKFTILVPDVVLAFMNYPHYCLYELFRLQTLMVSIILVSVSIYVSRKLIFWLIAPQITRLIHPTTTCVDTF